MYKICLINCLLAAASQAQRKRFTLVTVTGSAVPLLPHCDKAFADREAPETVMSGDQFLIISLTVTIRRSSEGFCFVEVPIAYGFCFVFFFLTSWGKSTSMKKVRKSTHKLVNSIARLPMWANIVC